MPGKANLIRRSEVLGEKPANKCREEEEEEEEEGKNMLAKKELVYGLQIFEEYQLPPKTKTKNNKKQKQNKKPKTKPTPEMTETGRGKKRHPL